MINILGYKKIDLMIEDYLNCKNQIKKCNKKKEDKVLNIYLNRYMFTKVK